MQHPESRNLKQTRLISAAIVGLLRFAPATPSRAVSLWQMRKRLSRSAFLEFPHLSFRIPSKGLCYILVFMQNMYKTGNPLLDCSRYLLRTKVFYRTD